MKTFVSYGSSGSNWRVGTSSPTALIFVGLAQLCFWIVVGLAWVGGLMFTAAVAIGGLIYGYSAQGVELIRRRYHRKRLPMRPTPAVAPYQPAVTPLLIRVPADQIANLRAVDLEAPAASVHRRPRSAVPLTSATPGIRRVAGRRRQL